MKRESILIVLGIIIMLSPWAGIPLSILRWILLILGLAILFIGFTMRRRAVPQPSQGFEPEALPSEPESRVTRIASF